MFLNIFILNPHIRLCKGYGVQKVFLFKFNMKGKKHFKYMYMNTRNLEFSIHFIGIPLIIRENPCPAVGNKKEVVN